MTTHPAPFSWPLPANTVIVTGTFDNWSGSTHHLTKQVDGGFKGTVEVPYGEKVAYKYVVDGQWMTREDEAKEWDAAGNMNNVYTAPAAPVTPAPAAAAATNATTVPSTTTSDPSVATEANLPAEHKTEPESLVAAAVPAAATGIAVGAIAAGASGQRGVVEQGGKEAVVPKVYGSELGAPLNASASTTTAPVTGTTTAAVPVSSTKEVTSAPSEGPTIPSEPPVLAEGASTQPTNPTSADPAAPLKGITSMFGTSPTATGTHGTGLTTGEIAAAGAGIGAGMLAAAAAAGGAVMSGVNEAVHAVTGVDIIHPDPEAQAQGINTKALPAVDSQVHAPSASLPPALPDKPIVQDSIMTGPANGIHASQPAAVSTSVPQPTVTSTGVSKPANAPQPDVFTSNVHDSKDTSAIVPKSEHDVPAQHETKEANHKHIPQPVITSIGESTKDRTQPSKADARTQPISDAPGVDAKEEKNKAEADALPSRSYIKKSPAGKDLAGTGLPLSASTVPTSGEGAVPPATPAKSAIPGATIAGPEGTKPAAAPAPGTPASKLISESRDSAIASPTSTAPSTPAKKTSKDSDQMRKRKSSFFAKVKGVFKKSGSED